MNKTIFALAMLAFTTIGMSKTSNDVPDLKYTLTTKNSYEFQGNAVLVDGQDWRFGLAIPFTKKWNSLQLDAWLLTDTKEFNKLYEGLGIAWPVLSSKNTSLYLTGGWSGDLSTLRNVKGGQWAVGGMFSYRF